MLRLAVNHLSLVVLVKGYLSALVRSGNGIGISSHYDHPSDRRTLPNGLDFEKGFMFHFSRFNSDLSELHNHEVGAYIDLTSYTSDSPYTFLSDGYLLLQGATGTSNYIDCRINNAIAVSAVGMSGNTGSSSIFVRKGMTYFTKTKSGNCGAYFFSLQSA